MCGIVGYLGAALVDWLVTRQRRRQRKQAAPSPTVRWPSPQYQPHSIVAVPPGVSITAAAALIRQGMAHTNYHSVYTSVAATIASYGTAGSVTWNNSVGPSTALQPPRRDTGVLIAASDLLEKLALKKGVDRSKLTELPIKDFAEFLAEEAEEAEKP